MVDRKTLQKYAIYSPQSIHEAPIKEILSGEELGFIGNGSNARVFRIKGKDWVVKEGKWDVKFDFLFLKQMDIPRHLVRKFFDLWSFTFFPDPEEVGRQYKLYLNLVEYLGYFDFRFLYKRKSGYYHHPNVDLLFSAQKAIRSSLVFYIEHLEKYYSMKFANRELLEKILTSNVKYHNFIPEEYLLYGEPISPDNKGKNTYYIFQEYVPGDLLHDVSVEESPVSTREQLTLLTYLLLLMNFQLYILPDTRPRSMSETFSWLTKTDNIIASKKGVKFIDTRWFWETTSVNPAKRGIFVSDIAINVYKKTINNLLKTLEK